MIQHLVAFDFYLHLYVYRTDGIKNLFYCSVKEITTCFFLYDSKYVKVILLRLQILLIYIKIKYFKILAICIYFKNFYITYLKETMHQDVFSYKGI